MLANLAREAAGESDEALVMLGEEFLVHTRLVVEAFEVRCGDELHQVLVAILVLREQEQVLINFLASSSARAGLLLEAAAVRHIDLATDDGFDALLADSLVEVHCAVEHAVVRDGHRAEVQLLRPRGELVQAARGIQKRILRVQVQMDKLDKQSL